MMVDNTVAEQEPSLADAQESVVGQDLDIPDSTSQKRAAEDDSELESGEATDDSDQGRTSTFPRKRARLESLDAKSVSDDVDEGEIIESSSSSDDEQENAESDKEEDAEEEPAHAMSEPPKVPQGWNKGVSSGLRTSFGASSGLGLPKLKQTGKTNLSSSFQAANASPTQTPTAESDKSVTNPSNDTRGNSESPAYSPPENTADMDNSELPTQSKAERQGTKPLTLEDRQKIEIAVQALTLKEIKPFVRDRHPWALPALSSDFQVGVGRFLNWSLKFEEWCRDFLAANKQHLRNSPVKVERFVWDAYQHYTEQLPTLSKTFRKNIKAAATDYRSQGKLRGLVITALGDPQVSTQNAPKPATTTQIEEGEVESIPEIARPVGSQDIEMTGSHHGPPQQGHSLIHRYYPGIADDAEFCLTCASLGHREDACPDKTCKFCQEAHFFYECPSRRRCGKCQQLGHTKASCKEKLALAPGEEGFIECAFCQGADHFEDNCPEIWRSYHPDTDSIRKVNKLPVFCYSCGQEGHYGGDCGIQVNRYDNNPKETWTKRSLDLYIDPESPFVALVYESPLPVVTAAPDRPNIPGRSIVPQTHIFFDDSDDEAENAFIKAPVQRQQGPGQIRISSNIDFNSQPNAQAFNPPRGPADDQNAIVLRNGKTKRGRPRRPKQAADAPVNPPLPPGPPPPAPVPGHATLPPRPAGQQNNNPNPKRGRPRRDQLPARDNNQQQMQSFFGPGGGRQQGQGQGQGQGQSYQGQGPPRGGGGSNRGRGGFSSALGGGQRPKRGGRA